MRIKDRGNSFTIWLSADDTYEWAHRIGFAWPCSTLAGHRLRASFDTCGLYDIAIDGKFPGIGSDVDGSEVSAIVSDYAAARIRPEHPAYYVAIGQFRAAE